MNNTRSTAVFIIKYLKTFGFAVSNETFSENSWYFRNVSMHVETVCLLSRKAPV